MASTGVFRETLSDLPAPLLPVHGESREHRSVPHYGYKICGLVFGNAIVPVWHYTFWYFTSVLHNNKHSLILSTQDFLYKSLKSYIFYLWNPSIVQEWLSFFQYLGIICIMPCNNIQFIYCTYSKLPAIHNSILIHLHIGKTAFSFAFYGSVSIWTKVCKNKLWN